MSSEKEFFANLIEKKQIRISVRSLCFHEGRILAEQSSNPHLTGFYFPGGELEWGELMEERLRIEFEEETTAKITTAKYLFVVENRFKFLEEMIHSLEHYFLVELDNYDLASREPWIRQEWLPVDRLKGYDLKPLNVRDVIADGSWKTVKHIIDNE
ncbi:MAG: NUDIX domain-containing protein [Candidatus Hodarchaeales archaeon]|jgi:ADP-ribose pyrophosphatase YjhB (NUDIX family)